MIGVWGAVRPVPGLDALLGQPVVFPPFRGKKLSGVAVYGSKTRAAGAARFAARHGIPWFRVGHGLVNAPELRNPYFEPPLSVVIDDTGMYDDARQPSRLERLLAAAPGDHAQRTRARRLIEYWRQGRLSRFNDAREESERLPADYVLVIDEWAGGSIGRRLRPLVRAEPASFARMLETALAAHPGRTVLIHVGSVRGHLDLAKAKQHPNVRVLTGRRHPAALLERATAVYTVGSPLGFEALLWGRLVHTFGVPFYAGWGLTVDHALTPGRRHPVALEDFVHAILVEYSRYRHPDTGLGCEAEEVFDWLAFQRRMRVRFPATLYAVGFSFRKRRYVRDFLQGSTVHFVREPSQAPPHAPMVRWGRRPAEFARAEEQLADTQRTVIRLEDGFLRSVGLGASLVRPLSWVLDQRGIYYDATRPSELEHLLLTMTFDEGLLMRARRLGQAIVAGGITKYNLGTAPWKRPPDARKVILVPGQVETDASLRYGAPGVKTNLGLLQAVRAANPLAYVVYKPHPDVLAGLRARGKGEDEARAWCDEQVDAAPMGQLLLDVDEVHVLTSLAGFEALLRDKPVTCYGQPFFAGWGLTVDMIPVARRTRRVSLDALLAATLIVYPTYISRVTGQFTTPERVLEELQQWRAEVERHRPGWFQKRMQPVFHAVLRWMNDPSPEKWAADDSGQRGPPDD